MLGELVYRKRGDGRPRRTDRCGLPVLEAAVPVGGWRERGRVRSAARRLWGQGVGGVVGPAGFSHWDLLTEGGMGGGG